MYRVIRALCRPIAVAVLALLCGSALGQSAALRAKLAGQYAGDFTLVYRFEGHDALASVKRADVEAAVHRRRVWGTLCWIAGVPMQHGVPIQDDRFIDLVMHEVERQSSSFDNAGRGSTLTISERGGRLLVRRDISGAAAETFLYDGRRSLVCLGGSSTEMKPGLAFADLRCFVFPGFGVAGVPLARGAHLKSRSSTTAIYSGQIATPDGFAGPLGLPNYLDGTIKAERVGDDEQISEVIAGHPMQEYRCVYSDYRSIGPGRSDPASIRLTKWSNPFGLLPYKPYQTFDYHLIAASDRGLPARDFSIDSHLTRQVLVHDTSGAPASVYLYQYQGGSPLMGSLRPLESRPLDTGRVLARSAISGMTVQQQFDAERGLLAQARPVGSPIAVTALGQCCAFAVFGVWLFKRRREA